MVVMVIVVVVRMVAVVVPQHTTHKQQGPATPSCAATK